MPPQTIIAGGHPRSGTTLLAYLLNTHPKIEMTHEFRIFRQLAQGYEAHLKTIRQSSRGYEVFIQKNNWQGRLRLNILRDKWLMWRYRTLLAKHRHSAVTFEEVTAILAAMFPKHVCVGDKFPPYWQKLDEFVQFPNTKLIFIYRDVRDVAQSVFRQTQTSWRDLEFVKFFDTPEKLAQNWLRSQQKIESHRHHAHMLVLRYEDLVANPLEQTTLMADFLGVDVKGFDHTIVRDTSIGKYRKTLTPEQIAIIEAVAGETMLKYGYALDTVTT